MCRIHGKSHLNQPGQQQSPWSSRSPWGSGEECVSAGTHQACAEERGCQTAMHSTFGIPREWEGEELSHSNFCPSPEVWCLNTGHGGCRGLGYGALSLGTSRERQ